jgi:hypothetical protein
MLIGRVIRDQIEDQFQSPVVRGSDQRIEIIHRPEDGIDGGVVGDVVTEIRHRRRENR